MAAPNILTLNEANFTEQVLHSPVPILVDFWAEWCGPCRMVAPILDELASEYDGQIKVGKVNVDDNQQLAADYRITGIPTLLLFKQGRVEETMVGLKSKRDLKANIEKVLTPS
ncbi:MAG: thioredoxin [Verrucomicrobia bacterium]|nr:thioredoxin [Verrucomicrobiales bacterium]MCZ7640115.1 thioredoxin [Verrucomicrobiota bacterium]